MKIIRQYYLVLKMLAFSKEESVANKHHSLWFKISRRFHKQPVTERLYHFGFYFLIVNLLLMLFSKKFEIYISAFNYTLITSIIFIVFGFIIDLYALGKALYKYIIFKWLFALSFSALVVTANILAKKDIYAITGFNLLELTEAQFLIAIVNIPFLFVMALTLIAMAMSLISIVGYSLVCLLRRLNRHPLSRILVGTANVRSLLKFFESLGFDSNNRPMAACIFMSFFVACLVSPPSYEQISLQSIKAEIIAWSSFYNGKDCKNLELWQGYIEHNDKTIILTHLDDEPSFGLGNCEKI